MKRTRRALVVGVLTGVLLVGATPSSSAGRAPLRSGRIISGVLTTSPAWDCEYQADCAPWLASGCNPALAGREPAWLTSIVNVRTLADGTSYRTFEVSRGADGLILGGVALQFWRADCTEIRGARFHSFWDCHDPNVPYYRQPSTYRCDVHSSVAYRTWFPVPKRAAWMTVAGNDNVNIAWTLR